ncbi:MAG TPA: outer membrane protein transport protein [Candidatus Eisenbacteria bacterium]|jgi:long-chain fatty acid transport protein
MNTNRLVRTLALAALLAPAHARAAGYSIYEQGAAAIGMAGAYVASAHDATAQFYNPAALTRLNGSQLSIGGSWLTTRTSFAGVAPFPGYGVTEEMKNGTFFPPNAYWTSHLGSHWAYGLGVNAPFGLGVEWKNPEQFTGRERVTKATLQAVNGSLDLAWAPGDALSLAAGFNALYSKVELNNIATFVSDGGQPLNVSRAKLESDFTPGYGWNAAALANAWTNWRLALSFKSKIKVDIDDGRATFTQIPTGDAPLDAAVAASLPANQGVKTQLVFPASLTWGLAWNPQPEWTYEIDGVWTGWSAFEKLPLKFAKDASLNQDVIENYGDQYQVRVGTEHRSQRWTWRAGYYFDQAAAPPESLTPLLPDANRHGATLGFGADRGHWHYDLYNLFLFVEKRSTEQRERDGYDGVYKTYVNSLGATLAYHW